MKRTVVAFALFMALLTSCGKLPWPNDGSSFGPITIEQAAMYDSAGAAIKDYYAGQLIALSSDKLLSLNESIDLVKEGRIQFDQIVVPILKAEKDRIMMRVPPLNRALSIDLPIRLLIRDQTLLICPQCQFVYRPTVTGVILAGNAKGKPDGTFELPAEMALDAAGNLYVIDQRATHDVVLKVTPAGVVSTFAGAANEFGKLAGIGIDNTRNVLYVADATVQRVLKIDMSNPATVSILAGSGTAGNTDGAGIAASFHFGAQRVSDFGFSEQGQGLSIDHTGNIYVGENYGTGAFGSQVRKITPEGVVTTLPGSQIMPAGEAAVAVPAGVTITPAGDVYYAGGASGFFQGITRITTAGVRSRFAGKVSFEGLDDGTGAAAQFSYPKAITHYGTNLYVADGTNGALRRVAIATGEVITLAGVGHFNTNRFCGCGTLPPLEGSFRLPSILIATGADYYEMAARAIRMDQVGGVAASTDRLIYVSDHGYKCIWKITIY